MTTVTVRRKHAFQAVRENNLVALAKAVKNPIEANWREYGRPNENTLLELACEIANIPAAEWLADHGADINACFVQKTPPRYSLIAPGMANSVSFLGPLSTAIYFGQPASLAFLLSRQVNLDLPWDEIQGCPRTCREILAEMPELLAAAERICLDDCTSLPDQSARPSSRRL